MLRGSVPRDERKSMRAHSIDRFADRNATDLQTER